MCITPLPAHFGLMANKLMAGTDRFFASYRALIGRKYATEGFIKPFLHAYRILSVGDRRCAVK